MSVQNSRAKRPAFGRPSRSGLANTGLSRFKRSKRRALFPVEDDAEASPTWSPVQNLAQVAGVAGAAAPPARASKIARFKEESQPGTTGLQFLRRRRWVR